MKLFTQAIGVLIAASTGLAIAQDKPAADAYQKQGTTASDKHGTTASEKHGTTASEKHGTTASEKHGTATSTKDSTAATPEHSTGSSDKQGTVTSGKDSTAATPAHSTGSSNQQGTVTSGRDGTAAGQKQSAAGAADTQGKAAAAGGGSGKLYTVVDGNKVDENTLKGWKTWRAQACERCHGANQEGMVGPSLINSLKVLTREQFDDVMLKGRIEKGMPNFSGSKAVVDNLDGLYAYLKGRSEGDIKPGRLQPISK